MSDIVAFLKARLDEDQAAAEAATAGPWTYNPGKMWLGPGAFERFDLSQGEEYVAFGGPSPFTGCVAATGEAGHPQSMADAAYIARHDPARVLREVAAKRKLIDVLAKVIGGDWVDAGEVVLAEDVLRHLAAAYSDRPGFQEGWNL